MIEPDDRQDRRNLAETLRDLRKAAGLSGERLAARVAMSQSKISRIESGRVLPSVADVERMLRGLESVSSDVAERVLSLARVANVEHASWRSVARSGMWRKQVEIKALTESSAEVRHFLPIVPSGLLQTPEYARYALTPVIEGNPARDVDRAVRARLDSQDALNDTSRRFHFLLTEQAVRLKRAPSPVMAGQLRHMVEVAERSNVEFAVLPGSVQVGASPLNVFVAYDDRLVIVELFSGEVALRDYRDVSYHLRVFEYFRRRAVIGEDARGILESVADDFMRVRD
ncbi:helix-turn-helix domain-containing protein [Actinophytocola sp. NPDC049390]|uniref:helix-turn-helix domain-containing protein n=1 Tax=Actinophytocola sp. NPDC049390 TaxID=3363894 RepID=UPI0037A33CFC